MTTCTARRDQFRGWDACILENEFIRLVAVPDIGGRIMAYNLGPYPFFFVDPLLAGKLFTPEENQGDGSLGAWKNYGGDKTWPAPQGWENDQQWHGPPDPILDTGRYTVDLLTADGSTARISMTSPPDPRTGVQITRAFSIQSGSSRVTVDLSFYNHTNQPIRWGIWDVVQLRAERQLDDGRMTHEPACVVTTPLNPNSVFPNGYNVMFGDAANPQWTADRESGLFSAPYMWQIGKVGLDSPGGWIAFSNAGAGYAFTETFTYQPGAEYPDQGATVEVWTIGAGQVGNLNYEGSSIYLMETEVLSPMIDIEPGARAQFTIHWGVCRSDGPISHVTEAGATTKALHWSAESSGYARVRYVGSSFEAGGLSLVWRDQSGHAVGEFPLGQADPLTLICLDRVFVQPPLAHSLELNIALKNLDKTTLEV